MLKKLLQDRQFHRFILVGILNTAVGYGLFVLFIYIGWHYVIASFAATILGILFNFHSIGKLVFGHHRDYSLIVRFFSVYGIVYLFNLLGLYLFDLFGISMYIAGAVLLLPSAIMSFLMNKFFVFGTHS